MTKILHHFKNVAEYLRAGTGKGSLRQSHRRMPGHQLALSLSRTSILTSRSDCWDAFPRRWAASPKSRCASRLDRIMRQSLDQHRHELVKEVLGQAKSNGRGVTGLRRVLRSLEMGEVQVLLMAENYSAHAVECASCGHLDAHMVRYCPVCGRSTQRVGGCLRRHRSGRHPARH